MAMRKKTRNGIKKSYTPTAERAALQKDLCGCESFHRAKKATKEIFQDNTGCEIRGLIRAAWENSNFDVLNYVSAEMQKLSGGSQHDKQIAELGTKIKELLDKIIEEHDERH